MPSTTPIHDTYVDIAVFITPDNCARDPIDPTQCDYAALAVGKHEKVTKSLRWRCSKNAAALGLCYTTTSSNPEYGRLLYDDDKNNGY